uniref:phage tail tip lysozyme n=1 Tax=Lachnoclostridium phocaeense TaxID=1871021 RepID=UPI0026DD0C3F|nr:phage tail tip lysozyme [Lachnoclostridium phocaeense]
MPVKCNYIQKEKKIKWTRGSGEFLSLSVVAVMVTYVIIMITGFLQLSAATSQITKAVSTAGRSAAVCTSLEDAQKQVQRVAETAILSENISGIQTSVDYAGGSTSWEPGAYLKVTVSASVHTIEPFISRWILAAGSEQHTLSGNYAKSVIVSVENGDDLIGDTNAEQIFNYLTTHGMTPEGAAGMMGNLQAESGLNPAAVQGHSHDATYCQDYLARVDSGEITRAEFVSENRGFGLAQWTSRGRRGALYDHVQRSNASIGDLEAQLEYLVQELQTSYRMVWNVLSTTHSVRAASDIVLHSYEAPADQSAAVELLRFSYALMFFNEFN